MQWVDGNVYAISNWHSHLHKMFESSYSHIISELMHPYNTKNCSAMCLESAHVSYTPWILIPCDKEYEAAVICEMRKKHDGANGISSNMSMGSFHGRSNKPIKYPVEMTSNSMVFSKLTKPTFVCLSNSTYIMGTCYKVNDINKHATDSNASVFILPDTKEGFDGKIKRFIHAYLHYFQEYCPIGKVCCGNPNSADHDSQLFKGDNQLCAGMQDCCHSYGIKTGGRCAFL